MYIKNWLVLLVAACVVSPSPLTGQGQKLPRIVGAEKVPEKIPTRKDNGMPRVCAVIMDELPYFADPDDQSVPLGHLAFGDLRVIMEQRRAIDREMMVLLAKYKRNTGRRTKQRYEFLEWVGWVRKEEIIERFKNKTVTEVRRKLQRGLRGSENEAREVAWLKSTLGDSGRKEYGESTLRVVTHPNVTSYCYPRPETAIAKMGGIPLHPFGIYYVVAVRTIVRQKTHFHILLSERTSMYNMSRALGGVQLNVANHIKGWVDIKTVKFWCTREGFEINLTKDARQRRIKHASPIVLWPNEALFRKSVETPEVVAAAPRWKEEFDAPGMQRPWPPDYMRYPVLRRLSGGKRDAFEIAIWGGRNLDGKLTGEDLKIFRRVQLELQKARRKLQRLELVLVFDATESMDPVIAALKESMHEIVLDLRNEYRSVPKSAQSEFVVSLVAFRDTSDASTIEQSEFFSVLTESGLAGFQSWMDGIKANGGGNRLEYPYMGIRTAQEKLSSSDTNGASKVILVFGDQGNHTGKSGYISRADVFRGFEVQKMHGVKVSPIRFGAARTPIGKKRGAEFERQMRWLTRATNGEYFGDIQFNAEAEAVPGRLKGFLTDVLREHRAQVETKLKLFEQMLIDPASQVSKELVGVEEASAKNEELEDMNVRDVRALVVLDSFMEQSFSKEELDVLRRASATDFLMNVVGYQRVPEVDGPDGRFLLNILLTVDEAKQVIQLCSALIREFKWILDQGQTGRKQFRRLQIQALHMAIQGTPVAGEELNSYLRMSLSELQIQFKRLPIPFGCLNRTYPDTPDKLLDLIVELEEKSDELQAILDGKRGERIFPAGISGDEHIWLRPDELP